MLDELLAAWRETHDPALEEPIARIGQQLARRQPPLAGKTKKAIEEAWHQLAARRDPEDLDRLLDTPWPKRAADVEARLVALARWPADPRFGPKLLRVRDYVRDRAFDGPIGDVLVLSPSAKLEALLEGYNEHRFGRARAALAGVKRVPCDPALLARVPPVETRAPLELEAASYDDPTDDALRRVLADALQELGDPRGEFIALQLAIADGTATKQTRQRAEVLLAEHIDEWTAPLPNALPASCRFERGFLVGLTCTARGRALDASIARPEWRVVEELTLDGRDADVAALLRNMPRLRMLVTRDEILSKLASTGPFPGIRAIGTPPAWIEGLREAFPDVRVIAGQWAERWQRSGAFGDRVRALHRQARAHDLDAIVHVKIELADVVPLIAERAHGPRQTRFTVTLHDERGWLVSVERDTPRAWLMWGGGPPTSRAQVETLLVDLAEAGITEVHVLDEPRAREAVEYTLRNRKKRLAGCTITFDGPPIDLSATI